MRSEAVAGHGRAGTSAVSRERTTAQDTALIAGGSSALIEGLGHVRLDVMDLERSIAFYRDGLRFGFDGRENGDSPRARLHAGDLKLVLYQIQNRPARGVGHGVLLSVEVTGVDAYHDALVARGLVPSRPKDEEHSRRFTITDPDGYGWIFVQSLT